MMPLAPRRRQRLECLIAFAIPTAAFVHALWATWLKWGDLVVDCGRDLDTALQLSQGKVLYLDVRYYYGPLAPYLNGFLFRCFGAHSEVLMAAGGATAALMTWVLYRLARQFTHRWGAVLAATGFIYLCAFGHLYLAGIFNFVFPYAFAATYGMLAAATSLLFLIRHARRGHRRDFCIAVAALTLAALAKVEVLYAAAVAHGLFAAVWAWQRRFQWKVHGLAYVASAVVLAAVYGHFWRLIGGSLISDNLYTAGNSEALSFFAKHMGFGDLPGALMQMAISCVALSGALLCGGLATRFVGEERQKRGWYALAAAGAAAIYCFVPVLAVFRFFPVLGLLVFVALATGWRRWESLGAKLPHLLLWGFVLACLSRIPLRTGAFHYGFYLLPVALVALIIFWFEYLPRLTVPLGRGYRYVGAVMFAAIVCTHWNASQALYALHTAELATPRGKMRLLSPPGQWEAETVKALEAFAPQTRVLVIPYGVGLTFFSGTTQPYGFHTLTPVDLCGDFSEERVLQRLQANPPDVIVHIQTDMSEFGVRGLGLDYGRLLAQWIESQFELYQRIPQDVTYIQVLTRRAARITRRVRPADS